ncbi:hypothetical protein, partial [Flavobacterium sp.]|uniref:hypothetical protein n=1 Tax=Flavobacterium sp. TaxID=239 RepID=UPI00374D4B25
NISDPDAFYDMLTQETDAIPDSANISEEDMLEKMDKGMTDMYSKPINSDRELAFLKRFASFGIELFKADSALTGWSQLVLETPDFGPQKVKPYKCN